MLNNVGDMNMAFEAQVMDMDGGMAMDGMNMETGMEQPKDGVMTSGLFVYGICGVSLVLSIIIGALLAKKRIKKGFDAYED